ncbi:CdaR family protein [Erysipelothrix sp. Poltava]|nr:CdaR family protein [Erysipelothrix sp. Poltava]
MTLSTEFVNQNKLGSQYVLGTPELETQDVTIKVSKETMSQVAFVKALIDVSGQTEQFTTDAEIVGL